MEKVYISVCEDFSRRRRVRRGYRVLENRKSFNFSLAILGLLALFGANPMPFYNGAAFADPATTPLVDTSISITSLSNVATISLTPGLNFTASEDIASASHTVSTNNFTGYRLSLVATDDEQTLVGDDDVIYSLTAPAVENTLISTNAAAMNKWGIKPSRYVDTANNAVVNNFEYGNSAMILPAPTTEGILLDNTTTANSNPNNYMIKVGAMVNYDKSRGNYSRTVNLTAVANPTYYTVNYHKNTADTVTNMPASQIGSTTDAKIVLSNKIPVREDFEFKGWCDGTVDNAGACSGTVYQPSDDFDLDATTNNTTTLYAMWETSTTRMQNLAASECTATPSIVKDTRDGKTYTIQRLEDDNCWMLDNLALGGASSLELTPLDTNISANFTLPASTTENFTNGTTGYTTPLINTDTAIETATHYGNGSGKVGGYYNFCAASAGTYCGSSSAGSGDATADICPAGWRLPTGGTNGEWQTMCKVSNGGACSDTNTSMDMSNANSFQQKLSLPISGGFQNGANNIGEAGYFWSSTNANTERMYVARIESVTVQAFNTDPRYRGFSVRCVLDEDIPEMQNISRTELSSKLPNNGDTMRVKDTRDNNIYKVTNINGDFWMTQNLRFTGTNLTSEDSNVKSSKTLTYAQLDSNQCDTTNGYNNNCIKDSGSNTTGVWYNFAAATAGTITGSNDATGAVEDICPAGWKLPTGAANNPTSDFYRMFNSTSVDWTESNEYLNAFNATAGGYYYNKEILKSDHGYWWGATAYDGAARYFLGYQSADNKFYGDYYYSTRDIGLYVRCMLKDDIPEMQNASYADVTSELQNTGDTMDMIDTRDNNVYQITNINGTIWMTQNLRFTGTNLTPADSNVEANTTLSHSDLSNGNSYTQAELHDGGDIYGAWYNYAAATAGTITGNSNTDNATQDICPAGWRLPSSEEFSNITNNATEFNAITGGVYKNGSLINNQFTTWWSSDVSDATHRYYLDNNGTALNVYGDATRDLGYHVRCVLTKNLPKMQKLSYGKTRNLIPNNGDTTIMVDERDDNEYQVTNINGNIWMTQNLRFKGTNLTPANSNVANNKTMTYYGLSNNDPGFSSHCDVSNGTSNACIKDSGSEEIGVHYNYYAATAGTVSGTSNSTIATEDICPAGWKLPTGPSTTNAADFGLLANTTYTGWVKNTELDMFNGVAGGDYYNGSLVDPTYGYWWSASAANASERYYLEYKNDGKFLIDGISQSRHWGYSIRCVKIKEATLQGFTSEDAKNMAIDEIRTLKDERDGQDYVVAKLADGRVWMLDNLSLDLDETSLEDLKGNTNASDESLEYLKNGGGSAPYAISGVVTKIPDGSWASESIFDSPYQVTHGKDYVGLNSSDALGSKHVGIHYNVCAASAGSYCYPSGVVTGDITEDICPAGWRLPIGSESNNELKNLSDSYSSIYTFANKLSLPYTGTVSSGKIYGAPSGMPNSWNANDTNTPLTTLITSTRHATNSEGMAGVNRNTTSSKMNTAAFVARQNGYSVRCIAK